MWLDDPNYNEERRRYYGKRKGDLITLEGSHISDTRLYEVVEYGFMDNNSLGIRLFCTNDEPHAWTAEHCKVHTKVEDRIDIKK